VVQQLAMKFGLMNSGKYSEHFDAIVGSAKFHGELLDHPPPWRA
jgi:hypothetical protein